MTDFDNEFPIGRWSEHPAVAEQRARAAQAIAEGARGWHPEADGAAAGAYRLPPEWAQRLGFAEDDPLWKAFSATCRGCGLPATQFQQLTSSVLGALAGMLDDSKLSHEGELRRLGDEGSTLVTALGRWAGELARGGMLSKDDMREFRLACGTADGARMMGKLMRLAR